MGVWISSRISGGRNNPAVTLALATRRSFAWKKSSCELDVHPRFTLIVYFLHLQGFLFAQLLGGIIEAGLIYVNYIHAIDIVEGIRHIRTLNTAGLLATYAIGSPHPRSAGI